MKRKILSIFGVIFGIIFIAAVVYKFALSAFIDLNSFKPQIVKEISKATSLNFETSDMKFTTSFDFGIKITAKNPAINYKDNSKLAKADELNAKVYLLPFVFNKIDIKNLSLKNPEILISVEKNGTYKIQQVIDYINNQPKQKNPPEVNIKDGLISNYVLNYEDLSFTSPQKATIKGESIVIDRFNPEKFVKLMTSGGVFINETQKIKYNVKLSSELPFVVEEAEQPSKKTKAQAKPVNFIESLVKYNVLANIKADITTKNTKNETKYYGTASVNDLQLKINGNTLPASKLDTFLDDDKISLTSKMFVDKNSFFDINGDFNIGKKKKFDISVKSSEIQLSILKNYISVLSELSGVKTDELNKINLAGVIKSDFKYKSDFKNGEYGGFVNIKNTTISYKDLSKPISNINGMVNMANNQIDFNEMYGYIDGAKFTIDGKIDAKNNAKIIAVLPSLKMSTIENLVKYSALLKPQSAQIKDFNNFKGALSIKANLDGKIDKLVPKISITPVNAGFNSISTKLPIVLKSGNIIIEDDKADIKNLSAKVLSSSASINGEVSKLQTSPEFDLIIKTFVFSNDLKKIASLPAEGNLKGGFSGMISAKGTQENIKISSQAKIPNAESIITFNQYKGDKLLDLKAIVHPTSVEISDMSFYPISKAYILSADKLNSKLALNKILGVSGTISNINTKNPKLNNINIKTNNYVTMTIPILMDIKTTINSDLTLNGYSKSPVITGQLAAKNTEIPFLDVKFDSLTSNFLSQNINFTTNNLDLGGTKFNVTGTMKAGFDAPYVFRNINVTSDYINADKLSAYAADNAQGGGEWIYIVQNGSFNAKKITSGAMNILNTNLMFNVDKNGIAQAKNITANVFGGNATGSAVYNIPATRVKVDLKTANLNAKTFAKEFLQAPQLMSGTIDATLSVSTRGTTDKEMIANSSGDIDFTLKNGSIANIGSLSHYLGAVNIATSFLGKNNLNRISNIIEPYNTGKFNVLNGNLKLTNGNMKIENISGKGKYLSLYLTGNVNMLGNSGDMIVYGRASNEIVRVMGPLGSFSTDQLLNKIPKVGGIAKSILDSYTAPKQPTIKEDIPSEKIPLLVSGATGKEFVVKINGDFDKPSSVKSFKWVE